MDKKDSTILPELWIRDTETIKVFANEQRLAILKRLETAKTVKVLALELQTEASKLYYHINLLEKHGLIVVVDYNKEGNLIEQVYQVAAHNFKIVNPLIQQDFPEASALALMASSLDDSKEGFLKAYQQRDPQEGTPPRHPFFSHKTLRLNDAQLTQLHQRLDQLIQDLSQLTQEHEHHDTEHRDEAYNLSLVFYKSPTKEES